MGAVFKMNFTVVSSSAEIIEKLKGEGRRVIAAALGESALTLGESQLFFSDCIVIGNEGHGVSEETLEGCTDVIKIPMTDKTESLNAAIASAVLLWEAKRGGMQ
jgi:TrmH family RNA methyltransferase